MSGSARKSTLGAPALVAALAERHAQDVFVAECKNGPTTTGTGKLRRLDAWVLLKTWSPITTVGYEVKVSRSDWMRDQKIGEYLGLCHLFSIVTPKGLIVREELPPGVGLVEAVAAPSGVRLLTRQKPTRREIALPAELLVYVLMCRATIGAERGVPAAERKQWRMQALREWVEAKAERRRLGYAVSVRIREAFDAQDREQARLSREIEELRAVRERIVELGFDPSQSVSAWAVRDRLSALAGVVPPHLLREIEQLRKELGQMSEQLRPFVPGGVAPAAVVEDN